MNPIRKTTPDSEVVVSSEDERPWPSAPAFGSLPRKENGVPGFGGGIWAQKRGSVKMDKAARNNAANAVRDARLAASIQPPNVIRTGNSPSPSTSEGSSALPFAIPLHPTPKAGRSLSHSQGQREPHGAHASGIEHNPVLPLGLLSEEADTETDSELGGALTQTVSHPPLSSYQRASLYPSVFDAVHSSGEPGDRGGGAGRPKLGARADRSLEGALGHLSLDHPQRRWESHLGWEDLPSVNESRRHSLADIPTRRGSLSAIGSNPATQLRGGAYWSPGNSAFDYGGAHPGEFPDNSHFAAKPTSARANPGDATGMNFGDSDEQGQPLEVPSMYKVPFIEIADHERTEVDKRAAANLVANTAQFGPPGRPRKQLYIVSFKCSRVDVFYLLDNTGLFIKEGDIVIVEADRGQDLGTVQHANVSPDEARLYKRKYGEEQYKWLMMFSRNNAQGNVNPNAQLYGENQGGAARGNALAGAPSAVQGLPRDNFNNLKPKAIKRLANGHEIRMLGEKEGNEAKAKRTCQQKVTHLHLDMEILDAEWQWDFQKLIFYYYADHYINFKDLITELYRIYKTRIWLSAINPASFSQHALGQPPSGIGPGAITPFNSQVNNTYTMAYGADPDPYGAVPPYRIGYDTYTPNYPGIPGVANSFAPPIQQPPQTQPPAMGGYTQGGAPSLPPGVAPTGSLEDYNFYYDRPGHDEPSGGRPMFGNMPPNLAQDPYQMPGAFGQQNVGPHMGGIGHGYPGAPFASSGRLGSLGAIGSRGSGGAPSNGNAHQLHSSSPASNTNDAFMSSSQRSFMPRLGSGSEFVPSYQQRTASGGGGASGAGHVTSPTAESASRSMAWPHEGSEQHAVRSPPPMSAGVGAPSSADPMQNFLRNISPRGNGPGENQPQQGQVQKQHPAGTRGGNVEK